MGLSMTRETLVKIERGIQHIQASQLRGIRDVLQTTYDELLRAESDDITVDSDEPAQEKQPAGEED
jgi:transcriptional regulator with XRE-family HTH domain